MRDMDNESLEEFENLLGEYGWLIVLKELYEFAKEEERYELADDLKRVILKEEQRPAPEYDDIPDDYGDPL